MMVEFWWKILIASVVTTAVAKLLGCQPGIVLIFALSWITWTVALLILLNLFKGKN